MDTRILAESFERPPGFDLVAFWRAWCVQSQEIRPHYPVTLRVAPDLVPILPYYFGDGIRATIAQAGPPDADGWITLTLPFETLEDARTRILGLGRAAEVLEPLALRKSIVDFATQIASFYAQPGEC